MEGRINQHHTNNMYDDFDSMESYINECLSNTETSEKYKDKIRNSTNHNYTTTYSCKIGEIKRLINENGFQIFKLPNKTRITSSIYIYKDDVNNLIKTTLYDFWKNENKEFQIMSETDKEALRTTQYNISEKQRDYIELNKTQKYNMIKESMESEECELLATENSFISSSIYYLFDGLEYKTTAKQWNNGIRAHKLKCIHYTNNHIKELFRRENCKLISEYHNIKTLLVYEYNEKTYTVRFDKWKYNHQRAHLIDSIQKSNI